MPRVRIKPGLHHHSWDPGTDLEEVMRQVAPRVYGGSVLDVSPEEAASFGNKFEAVANATKVNLIRDPAKMVRVAVE